MNDLTRIQTTVAPPPDRAARVAVLIDGDNVPASDLTRIESCAHKLGNPVIRRVYADLARYGGWLEADAYTAIHCRAGVRRNHADMQLAIAALDLAYRGLASAFLIVSDDRDFLPLITHLCEMGLTAERCGKSSALAAQEQAAKTPTAPAPSPRPRMSELDAKLIKVLTEQAQEQELTTVRLNNLMYKKGKKIVDLTGHATWRAYLETRPDLYRITCSYGTTIVQLVTPGARSGP